MRRLMKRISIAIATALTSSATVVGASGALAQNADEVIARIFAPGPVDPDLFTNEFLAEVPLSRIAEGRDRLIEDFGRFVSVRFDGNEGAVELERAIVPVFVSLSGENRVAGLLLEPPVPIGGDPRAIAAQLEEAALGAVSIFATVDGEEVVTVSPDTPMSVASAFKLFVLAAYEQRVSEGLSRETVLTLSPEDRSRPSGVLQKLPAEVPFTLESLAGLMIEISDNTATDAMIRYLGRDAVEAFSPRNRPLLTTAEMFKLQANEDARAAFAQGDEAARRAVLDDIARQPLPSFGEGAQEPTFETVGWQATTRDLCAALSALSDAPALGGENGRSLVGDDWQWVGYKGGSDTGVFNLTASARDDRGRTVCVSFTANGNGAQPADRLAILFGALFKGLRPN